MITVVVGIPLLMIKKPVNNGIATTIILSKTPNMGIFLKYACCILFLTVFLIINSGIPTLMMITI